MGARRARLAHALRTGEAIPPPIAPETFEEERVLLSKRVSNWVTDLLSKSKYKDRLTRAQYIALLVEAACNKEQMLLDQEASRHNLIQPATHLPPGIAEAAERLQRMKDGPR